MLLVLGASTNEDSAVRADCFRLKDVMAMRYIQK